MASTGGVVELEFNEEQKAAMARALMAVVERAEANAALHNRPLKHGDVVDLLSDSESNSDCELLGLLIEDPEGDDNVPLQLVPFELKVELKQENYGVAEELVQEAQVTTTANVDVPPISSIIETTAISLEHLQSANKPDQSEDNAMEWPVPFEMVKTDTAELVNTLEAVDESIYSNDMQTDTIVVGDVSSLTSTFTNDQVEWSLSDLEEVENSCDTFPIPIKMDGDNNDEDNDDNACSTMTHDNVIHNPDYKPELDAETSNVDGVINLESSEDEEMETKVICLLESDMENDIADSDDSQAVKTTERDQVRTTSELIHLICPECGLDCGLPHKWKTHTESEHDFRSIAKLNLQTIIDRVGVICYQCKLCQRKFKTGTGFSKLLGHRISHMRFFKYLKCRLCEIFKANMPQMNRHLREKHYKIYQHYKGGGFSVYQYVEFHCPVCDKQLANYSNWRKHLIEKHEYFEKQAERVRHVRDNIMACNECDNEFSKKTIGKHLLRHEKHQSFRCKLCQSYSGVSLWHLSLHVRGKHGQGRKHLSRCMYCDKAYEKSWLCTRHMQRVHHKGKLCCKVCKKKFSSVPSLISHMNMKGHHKLK